MLEDIKTLEDALRARVLLEDIYKIYFYIDTFNYGYHIRYMSTKFTKVYVPTGCVRGYSEILMKALKHGFRILEESKVE